MIEKLFNHPHILHQTANSDMDMPNTPIAACIDASNLIILSQGPAYICIDKKSVPELCILLKKLAKERQMTTDELKALRDACPRTTVSLDAASELAPYMQFAHAAFRELPKLIEEKERLRVENYENLSRLSLMLANHMAAGGKCHFVRQASNLINALLAKHGKESK